MSVAVQGPPEVDENWRPGGRGPRVGRITTKFVPEWLLREILHHRKCSPQLLDKKTLLSRFRGFLLAPLFFAAGTVENVIELGHDSYPSRRADRPQRRVRIGKPFAGPAA